ncbi:hypothetical protein NBRC10512_004915 [Rhodotorula toruloides]|uniref:Extracellular metalloproteinase n=2 Tax=Rhodotorula toruloides TaxID=5286 RepID=A0A061AMU5_RHOTO|nr:Extracellular metalloproteinase 4 [Rhodotorula toruloides NP11]EMS24517.1 Extracellular metalloproteinase 4 [Rhodotorula toruloides NP11]CDR36031.1 RHTO0S01e12662g1_1 [Rhodotorula toruloides]
MTLRTRTHRTTRSHRLAATASLASLVSLGSSLVVPPSADALARASLASLSGASGESSIRKSINFGPTVHARTHDDEVYPSPALSVWNANHFAAKHPIAAHCSSDVQESPVDLGRCIGTELAKSFVAHLHPDADFRLDSALLSKHSGVVHAHFTQVVDGIPVANGNLNVNVDLSTGKVLSYGDSSLAASHADKPAVARSGGRKFDWKQRVKSWASDVVDRVDSGANQVVFGGAAPSHETGSRLLSHADAADPREGLLTFLAIQSSTVQLAQALESTPRPQLVDAMTIRQQVGGDSAHDLEIDTHLAGVEEPVKATMCYVHDGEDVRLAWKYELKTQDNMYEAYMSSDKSVAAGDEEPLLVVDWVRDFKLTGGELGIEAAGLVGSRAFLRDDAVVNAAAVKTASHPTASTTDEKLVAKMRKVQPAYKVFPWGVNAPDEGKRSLLTGTLVEMDSEASPVGWHTVPAGKDYSSHSKDTFYFETRGNNVLAQDNPSGGNSMDGFRANGGEDMSFKFPIHMTKPGTPLDPTSYINASVTELFYTSNEIHDLYYRYGFDEESGNFQEENFGRGGRGGDAVQANAQDGSGYNNANFATPPDGQRPRMRMYVWNAQQPYRDGDFEAGIVIHEYSHGLSTRLTGGPANSGCLGWGEAGGMGEGWGDFLATMIRLHDTNVTDYSMGEWASNRAKGIRYYRYSRNMTENPSTYNFLSRPGYWGVHAIGEVWAEMLFELAENLIDKHGFHPTLFPPAVNGTDSTGFYSERHLVQSGKKVPAHGNTLAVQLVIDGMKIQPCRPTFQNARDAIITADKALTGGENECIIWQSFAKRGLGPDATLVGSTPWGGGVRKEDYDVPKRCVEKKDPKGGKGKKDRKDRQKPALF